MKMAIRWLLIFSLLGGYSYFAVSNFIIPPSNTVYAQTIANNQELQDSSNFVVISSINDDIEEEINNRRRAALQRVINRFEERVTESEELCEVSEESITQLQQTRGVALQQLTVNGRTVTVATSSADQPIQQSELINPHCIRLNVYQQVILQLSAHLS